MKQLNTLVQDIFDLFGDERHEPSEENLEALGKNIVNLVRESLSGRDDSREVLRFSNLGIPDRQLWYKKNKQEQGEKLNSKTFFKFLYGHVIEQLLIFLIKEAGHTVENEQMELNVDGVLGHIDCTVDGVTVDVKSASPFAFAKFKYGKIFEDDPFGYIDQLSGYANIVTPDRGGAFLSFNKVDGDLHLLELTPSITKDHKPEERIAHLKKVLDSPEIPERCYEDIEDGKSGNRKLGVNCSYCSFHHICWDGLRTFLYAGSPRHLTVVNREPDVPELK